VIDTDIFLKNKMEKSQPTNYLEAVNNILNGTYVGNLDELRIKYNNKITSTSGKRKVSRYTPEAILVSFVADAENKILLGKNPKEIYSISKTPEEFRKSGRHILENWINYQTAKSN
jgi:hypothetical protein